MSSDYDVIVLGGGSRADRERGLLQPLARLGAERVGAGQPLVAALKALRGEIAAASKSVGAGPPIAS